MKKFFTLCLCALTITACSDEQKADETSSQEINTREIQMFNIPSAEILNQAHSFKATDSDSVFADENAIIKAINLAVQCTLSPHNANCTPQKLPKFILMEDESLQRPTQMQYKITKIQPLAGGILHIYTQSQCNNNWFGLCQGNIIYVLQHQNDIWTVTDIFALESTK